MAIYEFPDRDRNGYIQKSEKGKLKLFIEGVGIVCIPKKKATDGNISKPAHQQLNCRRHNRGRIKPIRVECSGRKIK